MEQAEQRCHQRGRDSACKVRAREEDTLDFPALGRRDPEGESACGIGPCAGLACAEQKPDCEQRPIAVCQPGGYGESGPPRDDACQYPPRSHLLAPPRRRDFEGRVGVREGAEHEAHLEPVQPEISHDERSQRRDAHTVKVGDGRERDSECHHTVADMSRLHGRSASICLRSSLLCVSSRARPGARQIPVGLTTFWAGCRGRRR